MGRRGHRALPESRAPLHMLRGFPTAHPPQPDEIPLILMLSRGFVLESAGVRLHTDCGWAGAAACAPAYAPRPVAHASRFSDGPPFIFWLQF